MEYMTGITNDEKSKKTLKYSFFDSFFSANMLGFVQDYFTPFLIFLGGTVKHVGILSALSNLFSSLIQLKTADFVMRFKSRKKIFLCFVFLQAFALIPMATMAIINYKNISLFILLVILFTSFGAVATPAWASLMSDIVPEKRRGEYFGWRNRVLGFVTIIASFAAGIVLYLMKRIDLSTGFFILFISACAFRYISWCFLTKMHEPELAHKREDYFNMFDFLARIRESNFAKFVIFISIINFSVNIVAPFFPVLMLKDLHFNYLEYTLVTVSATLIVNIMAKRWGKHSDKIGNLRIIKFTAPIIGILPFLWVINQHPLFLIFAQIVSGFVWSGFNLSTSNFIYDAVTPEKRTRCIAYFNVLNGLSLCLGSLTGVFLMKLVPGIFGYKILSLCIISGTLRLIAAFLLPIKLKEVRQVDEISDNELFLSMLKVRPVLGIERKTLRY